MTTIQRPVRKARLIWCVGVFALVGVIVTVLTHSPVDSDEVPILGVQTARLFQLLGVSHYEPVGLSSTGMIYRVNSIPDSIKSSHICITEVYIGVFPSVEEAQNRFRHDADSRAVLPQPLQNSEPGEQFFYWYGPYYISSRPFNQGVNRLMRRENVVLACTYYARLDQVDLLQKAVADATRIDNELCNSTLLAPRGEKVSTPQVTLSNSPAKDARDWVVIQVRSGQGIPLWFEGVNHWVTSGKIYPRYGLISGKQQRKIPIDIATPDNVVFSQSIQVGVSK